MLKKESTMRVFPIAFTVLVLSFGNLAFGQENEPTDAAPMITGMGQVTTAGAPTYGGFTNGNSEGLSRSICAAGEYAVGVEVDGADRGVRYCVGCVARLRVICQRMP